MLSPLRTTRSPRERRSKRWSVCVAPRRGRRLPEQGEPASVAPKDPDDDALDSDIVLVDDDRAHRLVRRLKADTPIALAVILLDGRRIAIEERDHGLAVVGALTLVDDDEVPVSDLLVDHRAATNAKHVMASRVPDETVGYGERLLIRDGLDRQTRGDVAE